jgi:tRNA(Ile)-lysidine synthase
MKEKSEDLRSTVKKIITERGLIKKGDLVLVGVSGGPDSLCLLHVLRSLSEDMGFSIEAVHVNHMLRSKESDQDEEYVRSVCRNWGINLSVYRKDVKRLMADKGLSLEAAARKARYDAFDTCAKNLGADRIAVAHNRNDQAETVLMNIMRGSGIEGVSGMRYIRGRIIRPLLDTDRSAIDEYCRSHGLSPRTDSSNFDDTFTRNRVRNRLFPFMKELLCQDPVESISRMAALLREDAEYLESEAARIFDGACEIKHDEGKKKIKLNINALKGSPWALASRTMRKAIQGLVIGLTGIEKKHICDVLELAESGRTGAVIHLPRGIRVKKGYDILVFYLAEEQDKPVKFQKKLNVPGVTLIKEIGLSCETEILTGKDVYSNIKLLPADSLTQFFDYERTGSVIYIRNRHNGDVFMPINSKGRRKLKDYLIDRKVPESERDKIPVVAVGNEIVWITGYNISDKFKVTENTKTVLKVKCSGYCCVPG